MEVRWQRESGVSRRIPAEAASALREAEDLAIQTALPSHMPKPYLECGACARDTALTRSEAENWLHSFVPQISDSCASVRGRSTLLAAIRMEALCARS